MRTCSVRDVFRAIVRLRGYDPDTVTLAAGEKAKVAELVNERVEQGWEYEYWPEIMVVELRQYRPTWGASENFADGDEVYWADAYWESLQDGNVGKTPGAEPTWWGAVGATFVRSIDFEQDGETEIGGVDTEACIFDRDPRVYPGTQPMEFVEVLGSEIVVRTGEAPLTPYVRFRPVAPRFSWTDWSGGTGYSIGDLVYVDSYSGTTVGETFRAIAAGTGKNPYVETGYWEPVSFPKFLRWYAIHGVHADQLSDDEGFWKEDARAAKLLEELGERMIDRSQVRRATWGRRRGNTG